MRTGVAASPGIAIGKAYRYLKNTIAINENSLREDEIESQLRVLDDALTKTKSQLSDLCAYASEKVGDEKAKIFESHLAMIEDEELLGDIQQKIIEGRMYPDAAVHAAVKKYTVLFGQIEDAYIRERIADIQDVCSRLINNICGVPTMSLNQVAEESIVIARDLTPSDTVQLNKTVVKGFCTDVGGFTSHTAIMARSLGIPAVVGLLNITNDVQDGDVIIVDGGKGQVLINPDQTLLRQYETRKTAEEAEQQALRKLINLPAETRDRARIVELAANIGSIEDCDAALENGAEGVGLLRTEFFYMGRSTLPSEEEQFQIYKSILQKMAPHAVTIRTLDIGGDKKTACIDIPEEGNPFLGWRAIRICLERTDIFKTQLRAILRASHFGEARILFPMISDLSEIRMAKSILKSVMQELDHQNIEYNKTIEVGIMIEVPAAAIAADILIQEVDFFSIGTNDLIQYTLAVDRMNGKISNLYKPFHIAVLRLVKNVVAVSHDAGKWTGMCGELAGCAEAAPILLGFGLDELSMSSASLLKVKSVIRSCTLQQAEEIARKALSLNETEKIEALLAQVSEQFSLSGENE